MLNFPLRCACPYNGKWVHERASTYGFAVNTRYVPILYPERPLIYFLEVIDHVKSYLVSHPDVTNDTTRWIIGMGWDQTKWPGERFPIAVRVITLGFPFF